MRSLNSKIKVPKSQLKVKNSFANQIICDTKCVTCGTNKKCGTKCGTNCGTNNPTILRYLNQILIAKYLDVKEVWVLEVWVLVLDTRFQVLNFTKSNRCRPALS